MADIKRLPGNGCRHYALQRCLYQEHLNPGYHSGWRCAVLLRWEKAFDDFLERAEAFGLAQDAVSDLWKRQFDRMAREAFDCEDYSYSAVGNLPPCVHVHDGLCLPAMPPCTGRCRHYETECSREEENE